ncbi:Endonuclease/Exonuclease/phosphatase family protein [Cognatiyoonia koreensis]|uniref:Endonuclease/Exonuclease/phosphatase family protein n=1 Tax=Cognatiyoonia koreensis TaxID=364200 RepID=A0A1I0NGU2_9RHOB|nr:endonuclease/exonuclease/phosphatase family protein [Cognatiyoonia koreensis]SEV99979.1 Endonuclease/Exonuclease/phosphatase family protein [Cognatiyoonia koreensis]
MTAHFLAFWNLENLFGPEDHPPRIEWIKSRVANDLRGWTPELYQTKLDQLARIIAQMNGGAGPDILGVCEVEDAFVLNDLVATLNVPNRIYGVAHANSERDRRGIDTAFLFDTAMYDVDPDLIFNHFVLRRTGTRDILQATFKTGAGQDLIVLCNHWPSRSGGTVESAGFRATAGETLGYWHQRILEECGDRAAVVAFGDFNDDPFDPSLRFNAVAGRERGDVVRGRSAQFYNFAWEYLQYQATDAEGNPKTLDGTLYFRGDGNVFDQVLVNRSVLDGKGPFTVVDGSAGVLAFAEMVSPSVSFGPIRFGLPKGDADRNVNTAGFSDHFPVSITLTEAAPIA